jgi:glucan 1,3-beta-glucosidase
LFLIYKQDTIHKIEKKIILFKKTENSAFSGKGSKHMNNNIFENKFGKKIKGVNLGSWLVLEKWIVPSLFNGLNATDETSFCLELASEAETVLKKHWDTFIIEEDFKWIAERGLNAVRIPVGHWIFGPHYPYHHKYNGLDYPYVKGGIYVLDRAFDWAEKYGILIQIDLHAAPGCQNGYDHGGISGICDWAANQDYITHSLYIIETLAKRYSTRKALHSIHVLNEPACNTDIHLLKDYITEAYRRIRKHCHYKDVAVIFHDAFKGYHEFYHFLRPPEFENVILDLHKYQCFTPEDKSLDLYGHLMKTIYEYKEEADKINYDLRLWTIIGEWSLGADIHEHDIKFQEESNINSKKFLIDMNHRIYGDAQLYTYEHFLGWYFWTYKTENNPAWSFRHCVENGWLPDNFYMR